MFQIVRNAIFAHLKKENWRMEIDFFGNWESTNSQNQSSRLNPQDEYQRKQWLNLINEEVNKLDPQAQEMMAFCYGIGMTFQEISETMNVPRGTVCSKIHRSIETIRKRLIKKGIEFKG